MAATLLLADDHTLLREGIQLMLEPEFKLLGSVEDGHALLVAAAALKPDVVLLDIAMPLLNGIDAARGLRQILPSAKIVFLTMHADSDYVTEAFRAGASGYVLKRAAAAELRLAIREVLKGKRYVSPLVSANALELLAISEKPKSKQQGRLTARQREVVQLVAEGKSRKEIAGLLNITVKTVEFHKATLMREFNLRTVADFTLYAIQHHIIAGERSS